ncbi:hypothetical protein HPB47_015466 [Ixodes persulcatus]|uniref:Uncharacterized protein n=1 Tax=Ixodes persulcatus TaxID=34615 RepID=A0AC60QTF1_IXOPE|nr:hypothetical protein HPB47_015466 [Ixodes persulcatus]
MPANFRTTTWPVGKNISYPASVSFDGLNNPLETTVLSFLVEPHRLFIAQTRMYPRINDSITATVAFLKEAAVKDTEMDIRTLFSNYALDAIARCAFSTKMESHLQDVDDFAAKHKSFFEAPQTLSGLISPLTKSEALAQCTMFFLAGRDTSATSLAHAIYLLALNPEAQAKLRKEADECFEKHGEELTLDVVAKLKYVHGVVSETLRMLSPVTRLERLAAEDYVLGDTGIKLPKGCIIAVPVYSMHHDPEYFPDPFTFKPERQETFRLSIRPYTYLPFGAGPRNCIGNRFAVEVMKIALLHVVRSVEFYRSQNTPDIIGILMRHD